MDNEPAGVLRLYFVRLPRRLVPDAKPIRACRYRLKAEISKTCRAFWCYEQAA